MNLDLNTEYVLILNGSMGFGHIAELMQKLLKNFYNIHFIVSCGNNTKMIEDIKQLNSDRVIALGFVNNLEKYMSASEVVLTKPGGLTTTEIATIRKPFIHIKPIPGCENYNAEYFGSRKMSLQSKREEEIIENLQKLISDKNLQNELIKNQEKYINQKACENLVEFLLKQ